MKVKVLFNRKANHSAAASNLGVVEAALCRAGLGYELCFPGDPGAMRQAAMLAGAGDYDAVVATGGDGTVHAVVNGLIVAAGTGPTLPLGILPLGTGNDFADMAGLPRDIDRAAEIIAQGKTRQVDGGQVSFANGSDHNSRWQSRYFCNNCAVAMEPVVTLETQRLRRLSGNVRYVVGMLRGFVRLQSWTMNVAWDGGSFESPTTLLSVANTPRTGGQFLVAPGAQVDDGLLDLIFAPALPRYQVLSLLPKLFDGSHLKHPALQAWRTSRIIIQSRPATPIHADGEILCLASGRISCQVLPGKITLLSN